MINFLLEERTKILMILKPSVQAETNNTKLALDVELTVRIIIFSSLIQSEI